MNQIWWEYLDLLAEKMSVDLTRGKNKKKYYWGRGKSIEMTYLGERVVVGTLRENKRFEDSIREGKNTYHRNIH